MNTSTITCCLTTSINPGAVALLQLHGQGVLQLLTQLTGVHGWPPGRLRYVKFADIDDGFAVRLGDNWAQLMPHGGARVVQKLIEQLGEFGVPYQADVPATQLYPEASSDLEAQMLATLARAASPRAIDLLMAQPHLWQHITDASFDKAAVLSRSSVLDRLIDPPMVVVVGQPNVGKSTLTNHMLGRAISLVADLPGTTRDWVAGLAQLDGVTMRWLDTPGIHKSSDAVEQRAIELAQQVIGDADVLIAMRDPDTDWLDTKTLPRKPDLWVMGKADLLTESVEPHVIAVSVTRDQGIDTLQQRVVASLDLHDVRDDELWAFTPALREMLRCEPRNGAMKK